jgi:hypothetical protein
MTDAHTTVLLGGSGLCPRAWQRVTPILNARGFRTHTPQLRATGEDTTPAAKVPSATGSTTSPASSPITR